MAKISVVIPTYNRSSYLEGAIASVLAQTVKDFEVIVSDNCSQDDTEAVVEKYLFDDRVRYFKNEQNIGMVGNWRKAVYEHASGDWFILLSDDDYLIDTDYLANVSRMIEKNPSLVMVYANGYLLDESTGQQTLLELPFEENMHGVEIFMSRNTVKPQDFTLCNVVFNRKLAMNLNAFSNPNNFSCDSELFLKMAITGNVGVIKKPVSVYRFHSENLLKKIIKSPDLMYGNIDHLISPYLYAKGRVTAEQLATFKNNTTLEKFVTNTLLVVACYNWKKFLKWRQEIILVIPELCELTMRSYIYLIKSQLCRFGGYGILLIKRKI
ncbi:glycosyltransferase family 2 protein [Rhodoferax antarcticus]|uniref:glycosyltransferase family 2 protein n=1 Tax=Rhodoferax antarcticus TaxID=81479 RepID=UPI002224E718|nr:glycosyltransferase family 2 protein [Rhodoferax antarcticus]MCW2312608.1 glycosyltransferase involved in cell wall biosynthesis [Rhodoferax antarcticus]